MTKMRHGKMTHWSKGGEVKEEAKEKAEKYKNGGSVKARQTTKSMGKAC